MGSTGQITLFDVGLKDRDQAWSFNTWKTRLILNYKGLDYRTEFLPHDGVQAELAKYGHVNPEQGKYTIPSVIFPDGTYVTDSKVIAHDLEKRYPQKPLKLDSEYYDKIEKTMDNIYIAMRAGCVPLFQRRMFGKEVEIDQAAVDSSFAAIKPYVHEVARLLKDHPEGPFFEGKELTYADFLWVSMLRFLELLGDDVAAGTGVKDDVVHAELLKACGPWTKRETY